MKKTRIFALLLAIVLVVAVVTHYIHPSLEQKENIVENTSVSKESTDTENYEDSTDIELSFYRPSEYKNIFNGMPLPFTVSPEGAEMMLNYVRYLAARFGGFDIEYEEAFECKPNDYLYIYNAELNVDCFFNDEGFGIVQFVEYPGMCHRHGYIWRTLDYGKTWEINPEYESGFQCEGLKVYENNLFVKSAYEVMMPGWLLYSCDYGKTFEYISPEYIIKQFDDRIKEEDQIYYAEIDVLSVNQQEEYIVLSITGLDENQTEYCFFVGKFDFNINLLNVFYLDTEFLDSII